MKTLRGERACVWRMPSTPTTTKGNERERKGGDVPVRRMGLFKRSD